MSSAAASAAEPVIKCPRCGAEVKLTDSLRESVVQELRQKFDAEKQKLVEQASAEARRAVELELKSAKDDAAAKAKQLAEAQKNELELRRKAVELEDRARALDLEVQRKLDLERARTREQALKEFAEQRRSDDEKQRLKEAEKDKLIADLRQQTIELQRKAELGSQQLQGEVAELDLEASLRAHFPRDTIEPVAKGIHGGDCLERVLSAAGQQAGSILWESKRTKLWSDGWLEKLRDDQRAAKADLAVLVTQTLPKSVERFGLVDQVWVTDAASALPLAAALRKGLLDVATARHAAAGRSSKMELLYTYLTGPEFRRRVEAIVEAFTSMRIDLDAERRAFEKQWARREKQIERVMLNTAGMWGELEGIAGTALTAIEGLEPKHLGSGDDPAGS